MNLRLGPIFLLISGFLIAPQDVFALDCICVKYPMYPYSGTDWFHYAIKTKDACVDDYPLGQIQGYTQVPETCLPASCDRCSSLGQPVNVATVIGSHQYTGAKLQYVQLKLPNQILAYLSTHINNDHGQFTVAQLRTARTELARMTIQSPLGVGVDPPVVKLSRTTDAGPQPFYAVLWKMRRDDVADGWAYLGIEISDGDAVAAKWTESSTYRAEVIAKDEELLQSVIVKGLLEVKVNEAPNDLFLIRLFNGPENRRSDAFRIHPPRQVSLITRSQNVGVTTPGACVPDANQVAGQPCCENGVQMVSCKRSRGACRGNRRRCR